MKEIDVETLDNMFPDGYVIVYTCPDGKIRLALNNPHNDESLFKYYDCIKELN